MDSFPISQDASRSRVVPLSVASTTITTTETAINRSTTATSSSSSEPRTAFVPLSRQPLRQLRQKALPYLSQRSTQLHHAPPGHHATTRRISGSKRKTTHTHRQPQHNSSDCDKQIPSKGHGCQSQIPSVETNDINSDELALVKRSKPSPAVHDSLNMVTKDDTHSNKQNTLLSVWESNPVSPQQCSGTASPILQKMSTQVVTAQASPARALFSRRAFGCPIRLIPQHLLVYIIHMIVTDGQTWPNLDLVCKSWHAMMCHTQMLYKDIPRLRSSKGGLTGNTGINWMLFRNLGICHRGTEGTLHHCFDRQTGRELAYRSARVFPQGDGVPYYMLRELAFMRRASHPNIASLKLVNLHKNRLHLFFEYIGLTLHKVLYPHDDCDSGVSLPHGQIKSYMFQLLEALSYCHRRGLLHRNLKPKHILLTADGCLKIADFALARVASLPARSYTSQVVTLWYRAPEVILGGKYFSAVDMWSAGCIFAEMLFGAPTFMCVYETEVDHLLKIFRTLGTPTEASWPGFCKLPHAANQQFPKWPARPFRKVFSAAESLDPSALDLLEQLLCLDPKKRLVTHRALAHPYFSKCTQRDPPELSARQTVVLPHRFVDPVTDVRSFVHSTYQVLHERLVQDAESGHLPGPNLMKLQDEVHPIHRAMLVDWLVEVVEVFAMCKRTLFLAVLFVDRFLQSRRLERVEFQLMGAACLHIASKCEDLSYIGVKELVDCGDDTFTAQQLLQMEEEILVSLDFQLACVTVHDFSEVFLAFFPMPSEVVPEANHLVNFVTELCLQEVGFSECSPALVAAGVLVYSRHVYGVAPLLPDNFEEFFFNGISNRNYCSKNSVYQRSDLQTTVEAVHHVHLHTPHSTLSKIVHRYNSGAHSFISRDKAPALLNIQW